MVTREVARLKARPLSILSEGEQRPDLFDGETEITAAAYEGQPHD
jgi:hypothetical protein